MSSASHPALLSPMPFAQQSLLSNFWYQFSWFCTRLRTYQSHFKWCIFCPIYIFCFLHIIFHSSVSRFDDKFDACKLLWANPSEAASAHSSIITIKLYSDPPILSHTTSNYIFCSVSMLSSIDIDDVPLLSRVSKYYISLWKS